MSSAIFERPNLVLPLVDESLDVDWSEAEEWDVADQDLDAEPEEGISFLPFPAAAGNAKTDVNRAGSALRGVGRSAEQTQDVVRAEETVEALVEQLEALNGELAEKIAEVTDRYDPLSEDLKTVACRPRRADIDIRRVALMWTPD